MGLCTVAQATVVGHGFFDGFLLRLLDESLVPNPSWTAWQGSGAAFHCSFATGGFNRFQRFDLFNRHTCNTCATDSRFGKPTITAKKPFSVKHLHRVAVL
jgi:hypothetical protein